MALKRSPNGFAIRISSEDGDSYYRLSDGELAKFPTMQAALLRVDGLRRDLQTGMFPAVVPYDAVPAEERS